MDVLRDGYEFARQGGWPMVLLGLCAVVAITVILERAFALRRVRTIPQGVVDLSAVFRGESSVDETLQACRYSTSGMARILESLILARRQPPAQLTETMNAAGRREVEKLGNGLIALEIVAGVSPLLGLLGTVLGMVTVFDAISAEGLGNAQALASGISEALVTTITGLVVAIPALAFHSYFSKRVESLANEMHELGIGFVAKIGEQATRGTATPVMPAPVEIARES